MNIAHQPGSQPLTIPEQIPNPAVRPLEPPRPEPRPVPREPVKVPEIVPGDALNFRQALPLSRRVQMRISLLAHRFGEHSKNV